MIIRPEPDWNDSFAARMLGANKIQGLLEFQEKWFDGRLSYYYDITSKQPLERMLQHRKLESDSIRTLITDLILTIRQLERFLLREDQIFLDPAYIYIEPDTYHGHFCLVPGKRCDFSAHFFEFSQYLLDHVDHNDGDAVFLAFSVFSESRKLNFGIDDIERCLAVTDKHENQDREEGYRSKQETEETGLAVMDGKPVSEGAVFRRGRSEEGVREEALWTKNDTNEAFGERTELWRWIAGAVPALLMVLVPPGIYLYAGMDGLTDNIRAILALELGAAVILSMAVFVRKPKCRKEEPAYVYADKVHADAELTGCRNIDPDSRQNRPGQEEDAWAAMFLQEYEEEGNPSISEIESCRERECREDRLMKACGYEGDERWKEADEEDEMMTILLCPAPEQKGKRRLVSRQSGEEIRMDYVPFLIGKQKNLTDYCLDRPEVSRLHVKIEKKEEDYYVTDLNSTNGTMLNGEMMGANETRKIKEGDELTIASEVFIFR